MPINKKYKLTSTFSFDNNENKVYQIKALRDFGYIKKGQLGGFVTSEYNLSHKGNCWIYPNAIASEDAKIMHNAVLRDYSSVQGNSRVYNNTILLDNASLEGDACIAGKVVMRGNSRMKDNASAEGDDLITKSPIYVTLEHVSITITEHYVLLDYPKDAKHYTKEEWLSLKNKELNKMCGSKWGQKYKNILSSLIRKHN